MNKEEYPIEEELEETMQNLKYSQERIKYLERSNDRREQLIQEQRDEIIELEVKIDKLREENKRLEENWNKLKEKIKNEQLGQILYSDRQRFANIDELLAKIQELEESGK